MKPPAKSTLDPRKIFNQANTFYLANVRLRGNDHPAEHIKAFAAPSLVLSAFAAELYLKCLLCIEGKSVPPTHNLKNLFKRLRGSTQNRIREKWDAYVPSQAKLYAWIEETFGEKIPTEFEWALANGANTFDKIRYVHERESVDDRIFIIDLPQMLREVILEVKPEWAPKR